MASFEPSVNKPPQPICQPPKLFNIDVPTISQRQPDGTLSLHFQTNCDLYAGRQLICQHWSPHTGVCQPEELTSNSDWSLLSRRCRVDKYNHCQPACRQVAFNVLQAQHRHGYSLNIFSKFDFLPVYLWTVSRTLNSLFKVLFNCPSRYLFAIGLAAVFSLRGSLPPASDCNPKQSDSKNNHHRQSSSWGYDQ